MTPPIQLVDRGSYTQASTEEDEYLPPAAPLRPHPFATRRAGWVMAGILALLLVVRSDLPR